MNGNRTFVRKLLPTKQEALLFYREFGILLVVEQPCLRAQSSIEMNRQCLRSLRSRMKHVKIDMLKDALLKCLCPLEGRDPLHALHQTEAIIALHSRDEIQQGPGTQARNNLRVYFMPLTLTGLWSKDFESQANLRVISFTRQWTAWPRLFP